MPKPMSVLNTPIQQAVYNYLADHSLSYEQGRKVFGFGTRQALYAWVHKAHTGNMLIEGKIRAKLEELGAVSKGDDEDFDDLE